MLLTVIILHLLPSSWTGIFSWTGLCQLLLIWWGHGYTRLREPCDKRFSPSRHTTSLLTLYIELWSSTRLAHREKICKYKYVKGVGLLLKSKDISVFCILFCVCWFAVQDVLKNLESHQQVFQKIHKDRSVDGVPIPPDQLQDMAER